MLGRGYVACLLHGDGVAPDEAAAFEMFRRAAGYGMPEGVRAVALCYKYGVGVDKDEQEAARWQEIADENASEERESGLASYPGNF